MAQSYFYSHGSSAGGFSEAHMAAQYNQPSTYPAYPLLLGSGQIPDTLLYWQNDQNPQSGIPPVSGPSFTFLQQDQTQQSPPQQQQRQLPQSSTEQRKHKRTRSGCLTCRARRIKCDEARPVCERCRKGSRPCEYSNPNAKSSSRSNKSRRQSSQESISSDEEQGGGLDVIPDEDETADLPSSLPSSKISKSSTQSPGNGKNSNNHRTRTTSEASSISKSKSLSPASDMVSSSQSSNSSSSFQLRSFFVQRPVRDLPEIFKRRRLKDDVRYFLKYHQEKINHNHYLLNSDCEMFFRGTLLDLALEYEPLLYAIVGFTAYHYTLQNPHGKMSDFLKYYDQSLQLLRKSLASGVKHNEAMLATILQLSTFEETIGDFVNLVDHHQAADELIHELLTPQSIRENKVHRYLFVWHARFDLVACLIASNEAIMGREWYDSLEQYDTARAAEDPENYTKQMRAIASRTRLFAMEFASLFAQLARGHISPETFGAQFNYLNEVVGDLHSALEQYDHCEEITMPGLAVPLQGPEDVLDTDMTCRFYRDSKYDMNFMWPDVLATELMFKYQSHLMTGKPDGAELQNIALRICHHAESIFRWPEVEVGTNLAGHNWLILMTLFLPRDSKHTSWSRRVFARLEVNGYVYAPRVRRALAEVWNDPSVEEWWDPTDDEGCPNIVKEIRALTEERTTSPRDNFREDVRDLKSLFTNMRLSNSTTPSDQTN